MFRYFVFLFFFVCVVKSDNDSKVKWTKINNVTIEMDITQYCHNKNCFIKCCPPGQFLGVNQNKTFRCKPFTRSNEVIAERLKDLSEFNKYVWNLSADEISKPQFEFVHNDFYTNDVNQTLTYTMYSCSTSILKDGSLNSSCPMLEKRPALKFCADFTIATSSMDLKLAIKLPLDPEISDYKPKTIYIAAGLLISIFFMLLVLFVYAALPCLRNIAGMMLMSYLVSLIIGYSISATLLIYTVSRKFTVEQCKSTSPAFYYFNLASFFWLNIMSFDLWWNIRDSCKQRQIHRQAERLKFFWYSLYAWGVPALITLLLVMIARMKTNIKYKPPFWNCFAEVVPSRLYIGLPIGIMTIANCVMFAMTAYNIWSIRRRVVNTAESRNTKKNENRFLIYFKLFVSMGVIWVFDPNYTLPTLPLIPHIIVNFFTVFIGVSLFCVFVCKKSTINMLCKRFNIGNAQVDGSHA